MKEPLRSRKMNQIISEKKEEISSLMNADGFIETLMAVKAKIQQSKNL